MNASIARSLENITQSLTRTKLEWFRTQLIEWANYSLRDFPWRQTLDPYPIFVAEFLLQKTDALTVLPIYKNFLDRYPTLKDLATASVEEIAPMLKPLGLLFRSKRLCDSVQIILEKYRGKIPSSEAQLLELPGVGKYTARSICSQAFAQPLAVLDTNVIRILERFFGIEGSRVKSRCKLLWKAAEIAAPETEVGKWNLTLLDFGAMVCIPRKPLCDRCPLQKQCNACQKNSPRK